MIPNHHHHRSPPLSPLKAPRAPPLSPLKAPRAPPLSVSLHYSPPTSISNESPHSPLRSESPIQSDDPINNPPPSAAIVAGRPPLSASEKYYSPPTSPRHVVTPKDPVSPGNSPTSMATDDHHHHVISFNRTEEIPPQTGVVYGCAGDNRKKKKIVGFVTPFKNVDHGVNPNHNSNNKLGLGIRVLEFVFCLISFSVMASDKTQGWSGDSFDRYTEYRFCLTVTVLGFVYSGFQAFVVAHHMSTGKHVINHPLRCQFDFIVDQIFAYLLISASSAAATRVNDWESNWGKDGFTEKASASISMAFLAFICFAISSIISGYSLLSNRR